MKNTVVVVNRSFYLFFFSVNNPSSYWLNAYNKLRWMILKLSLLSDRAGSRLPPNFWSSYEYLIHHHSEDFCADEVVIQPPTPPPPPIMLTIEPRMASLLWTHLPISLKRLSSWCPFLDPHLTTVSSFYCLFLSPRIFTLMMNKIFHMSSKNKEESGSGLELDC